MHKFTHHHAVQNIDFAQLNQRIVIETQYHNESHTSDESWHTIGELWGKVQQIQNKKYNKHYNSKQESTYTISMRYNHILKETIHSLECNNLPISAIRFKYKDKVFSPQDISIDSDEQFFITNTKLHKE